MEAWGTGAVRGRSRPTHGRTGAGAGQRISRVATVISSSSAAVMSRARSFMGCLRCRAVRRCARPARSCAVWCAGGGRCAATPRRAACVGAARVARQGYWVRRIASVAGAPRGGSGEPGCLVRAVGVIGPVSPARAEPPRKGKVVFPAVVTGDEAAERTGEAPGRHAVGADGAGKGHGMVLRWVAMQRAALSPPDGDGRGAAGIGGGPCERAQFYRAATTCPAQAATSSRMERGSPSIFSESVTMSAPRPDRRSSMASTAPQK